MTMDTDIGGYVERLRADAVYELSACRGRCPSCIPIVTVTARKMSLQNVSVLLEAGNFTAQ